MTRLRRVPARTTQVSVVRVVRRAWIALLLLLLVVVVKNPTRLHAQEATTDAASGTEQAPLVEGPELGGVSGFDTGDWLNLGLRLGIVLVVIWIAVFAMRWYVRRSTGMPGAGFTRHVEVIETRALGPNRALHLVRIGERAVLVGATQERINSLMEIDDPEEVARLDDRAVAPPVQRTLRSLMGGLSGLLATAIAHAREQWVPAARSRWAARRDGGAAPAASDLPVGAPLTRGVGGLLGVRLSDLPSEAPPGGDTAPPSGATGATGAAGAAGTAE